MKSRPESPLVRQWTLLRALAARRFGCTVKELADELEVDEKTIRRDLVALRAANFPIVDREEEFGRKRWSVAADALTVGLRIPFDEALALYLACRQFDGWEGTPVGEAARRAFRKLRGTFDASVIGYLDGVGDSLHRTDSGQHDYAPHGEIFDELMVGLEDRRAVFITYRSLRATEPVTYDIHPYAIVEHRKALYVIGYSGEHESIRTWKLDRIEAAEATQVPFERPRDFDPAEHLAGSLGIWSGGEPEAPRPVHQVRIRFTGTAVRTVREGQWHASQQNEPQSDGSLIVRFELSDLTELRAWILSYGATAEALAPETLRKEIAQELETLQQKYTRQETKQ